jgi:DNA-binding CsgD family transcriptional regulator
MASMRRDLDARKLAGLVTAHRDDQPANGLPLSLLADLAAQIPCDDISLEGFDSAARDVWFVQALSAQSEDHDPAADRFAAAHWAHYWQCRPCSYPDRTGDLRSVVTIGDFYSRRQWHGTGMYADVYRPQGAEHELMLTFPARPDLGSQPGSQPGGQRTLRLFFFRGPGPDFSETDRAVLTLLRPHLYHMVAGLEQRRDPVPALTPRQWQLMKLLAAGHTNARIARQLGIAEGTVRTHLEAIYRRLGVTNRTAAVCRAFPATAGR